MSDIQKLKDLEQAIVMYYTQVSEHPETLSDLLNPPGGFEPYIDEIPKDQWGNEFIYVYPNTSGSTPFRVFSSGPDGKPNTSDDIDSSSKEIEKAQKDKALSKGTAIGVAIGTLALFGVSYLLLQKR
jgi:hypothetical protein